MLPHIFSRYWGYATYMFSRYWAYATLEGGHDAMLSLSFSVKSKFLAGTGFDGVTVWEMKRMKVVGIPRQYISPEENKYKVSTSAWVFFEKTSRHVLLLGGFCGDITAWYWDNERQTFQHFCHALPKTTTTQVVSMHVFSPTIATGRCARVVTAWRDSSVTLWMLMADGEFCKVFTTILDRHLPKTVRFDSFGNIYVFAYEGGTVLLLDKRDGKTTWCQKLDVSMVGDVAFDHTEDRLVVSTGKDFQVFSATDFRRRLVLESSSPAMAQFTKQIVFTSDGSRVLGGTDHGHAVLYNLEKGKIERKLAYPVGGLVQTVASSRDGGNWSYLALAGSTPEHPSSVIVWYKYQSGPIPFPRLTFKAAAVMLTLICGLFAIMSFEPTCSISYNLNAASISGLQSILHLRHIPGTDVFAEEDPEEDALVPPPLQIKRRIPKHRKKASTVNPVPSVDFEDHGDDAEEDDRPIPSPVQTKRPFPKPNKHRKNAATANAVPPVDFEDHGDDAEEDDRPIPSPVQTKRPFPKPNKHRKNAATANAVPSVDFEDHGDDVEEDDRPIPSPVQTKRPFPKPNKHRKNAATANAVPSVDFEDHEDDAEEDVPILPLHTERPSSDYHQKGFTIPPPIMEVVEGVDYDELDEGCGDGTCDTDYDSDDLD